MLSEFQREVIAIVVEATSDEQFALAGGAALIAKGLVDRRTQDLDFFAREPEAVGRVVGQVEEALRSAGIAVLRIIEAPSFVRLELSRGEERSELDLGYDARMRPEELTPLGPVVATEELAADKTLALFGRAAARDFVDVYSLARQFGEDRLCELAAEKDPGFDRGHFADALRSFPRLDRDLFEVEDANYDKIDRWRLGWAHELGQKVARELGPGIDSGRSLDQGPDPPDF